MLRRLIRAPLSKIDSLSVPLHYLENKFNNAQVPPTPVGILQFKMRVHVIIEEVEPYLRIEEASALLRKSDVVLDGLQEVPGCISGIKASPRAVTV
jgi:hypothetical protein